MELKRGLPIGGQALPNGVMMRCHNKMAIALRLRSGQIVTGSWPIKNKRVIKHPVFRGIYQFLMSLKASFQTIFRTVQLQKKAGGGRIAPSSYLSAAAALLLVCLYAIAADQLYSILGRLFYENTQQYLFALVYGTGNMALLCSALFLISLLRAVKKLLKHHGAEHKVISCYESGFDITVENVKAQSRFHKRCGTSMVAVLMLVAVIAPAFIPPQLPEAFQYLIFTVIVLFAAGLSYEVIRSNKVSIVLRFGLAAQGFTTKEPDDDMIECAVSALMALN